MELKRIKQNEGQIVALQFSSSTSSTGTLSPSSPSTASDSLRILYPSWITGSLRACCLSANGPSRAFSPIASQRDYVHPALVRVSQLCLLSNRIFTDNLFWSHTPQVIGTPYSYSPFHQQEGRPRSLGTC